MSTTKKTVSLNISERINALTVLNNFKGNLDKLAVILEDIKQLPITEEEWAKADRKIETSGTGENAAVTWKWSDEKAGLKEIVFDKVTSDYIKQYIDQKNEKGEFGVADRPFISLLQKLS